MPTNKNVLIDRNKFIGGSEIACIMGISHFKKRFDLLQEKLGLKENDFNGNEYTEYGEKMEPKIREYVNNLFETEFKEDTFTKKAPFIDTRCNVDGATDRSILEIKTTSQVYKNVESYKVYLVQLLYYMINTGREEGYLAVYERPKDFNEEFDSKRLQIFHITTKEEKVLIRDIKKAVKRFRQDYAYLKEHPFATEEEVNSQIYLDLDVAERLSDYYNEQISPGNLNEIDIDWYIDGLLDELEDKDE